MKKRRLLWCVILLGICACIALALMYLSKEASTPVTLPLVDSEYPVATEDNSYGKENSEYYRSVYAKGKEINEDYTGTVFFANGLVEQPFVQGSDNSEYLRLNWQNGQYDEAGTVFMDYENAMDDQNIILYGHYAYPSYDPSRTMMFTPLSKLLDEANYSTNAVVYMLCENEIREYRVAAVYLADLSCDDSACYSPDELQYNKTSYTEDYFSVYKTAVNERKLYETGVDFNNDDRLLTLQTCVENRNDEREIVICKQVDTYPITDTCSFPKRDIPPLK